jgi:hypothetical protein
MNLKETREHIAVAVSSALEDVTVHPYQLTMQAFHGWVEFDEVGYTDRELAYGEIGLTVTVNILVATDRPTFERMSDDMTPDLIAACEAAGGRATVVRPYQEPVKGTTFYMLSATFYTESEAA